MKSEIIKTEMLVDEHRISVIRVDNVEYISLTDLARYANPEEPKIPVQTWMRNKEVISYLGLWEKLNNINFKGIEFETFEIMAGKNSFYMSPQRWIKETNAIGIISKSGNIRDYTDLLHLVILSNLENTNAELIKLGLSQKERVIKLNESARRQVNVLQKNKGIMELENLQKEINKNEVLSIKENNKKFL